MPWRTPAQLTYLFETYQLSPHTPQNGKDKCIIIIISVVHATADRGRPQLPPCISILSHSHPLTATNFLDVVSPSPFGSSSYSFSFSGCPFSCYLCPPGVAPSGYMSCPLSSHAPHSLYYTFHPYFRSYYLISDLVSLCDF